MNRDELRQAVLDALAKRLPVAGSADQALASSGDKNYIRTGQKRRTISDAVRGGRFSR